MDSTRGHFVTNVEPGRSAELRRRPESFRVPDQRESVPRISGRNRNCRRMIVPAILSTPAGRRDLTDIIARPRAPPAWIDAQGNRANRLCCDEVGEVVVIPCGDLSAE